MTYLHAHTSRYTRKYIHTYAQYTHTHTNQHTCICAHSHTHAGTVIGTHRHPYAQLYMCVRVLACMCVYKKEWARAIVRERESRVNIYTHVCMCSCVCMRLLVRLIVIVIICVHGTASVSRIDRIIGLFCKRALSNKLYSAEETYNLIVPTDRSHLISVRTFMMAREWYLLSI